METLREALERFEEKGFRRAFRARPDGSLSVQDEEGEQAFAPEELVVEDVARFEGVSDPGDEAVLFALRTPDSRIRGTFSTSYGPHAEPGDAEAVRRLPMRAGLHVSAPAADATSEASSDDESLKKESA